ncbi:Transcription factor VIP1, partial [Cucurbita argyrosperma subsp. argyrosperma]
CKFFYSRTHYTTNPKQEQYAVHKSFYSNFDHKSTAKIMLMDPNFSSAKPPLAAAAMDIEQMPENPYRGSHHRRSHSDTSFRFPNLDELLFFDPSELDLSMLSSPSSPPSCGAAMVVDSSDSKFSDDAVRPKPEPIVSGSFGGHLRSLSVDSDFLQNLDLGGDSGEIDSLATKTPVSEHRPVRHRHSLSMDGSSSSLEANSSLAIDGELKLRLQAMEQQAQLRDALSEALKEEVQRLRIAASQVASGNGNPFNRPPQYPSPRPPLHHFSSSHAQQPGQQQQPPSILAINQQQSDPKWTNSSQLHSHSPNGQAKP